MEPEPHSELLGRIPIFQGLTPEQLAAIAGSGREVHFENGSTLLRAGENGEAAFLILGGSVVVQPLEHSFHPPELLGSGTLVGELAMLVETIFTVTVTTRWPVRALALKRSALLAVMEEDPSIAHHFAGKLLDRLRQLTSDLHRLDGKFAMVEVTLDQAIAEAGAL